MEVARGSFRSDSAVPPAVSQLRLDGARFLTASGGSTGGFGGVLVAAAPKPGRTELHRLTARSEAVEDTASVSSWADTDR